MGKRGLLKDSRSVIFATLGVVFFCGLGAIFYLLVSTPPTQPGPLLYPEPPLYGDVKEATVVKGDGSLAPISGIQIERRIHFKTDDTPQAVLAFYEDKLTKAGWSLFTTVNQNERSFYWTDGSIATGLYKANVKTAPSIQSGTEVTIETGIDTGGDNR